MKRIIRIARVELSILFYSPIAWLVLIIFMIQCGITFTDIIEKFEASQQLGSELKSLTTGVFGGRDGLFSAVQGKLFLYIPLLTMGLMSREISSGSIKLLLSSPVANAEIIFGKFLAMMAYGFLLIMVLGIITIGAAISVENLDFKFIAGGLLGLYLLICAYAAIGLFLSSLTSYQVVAAISTLAVLAGLKFVGEIGKGTEFVRDITYWISIEGRVGNFINGLISSKDVIYFLLVISFFLILSVMKLNAGRVIRSATANALRYALLVVSVLSVGYLSSLPSATRYYDTTRFKDRTLTKESQQIVKQLKKPVTLTSYPNLLHANAHLGSPKFRNFDKNQFEQYVRYLPGMKFNYVPYYDSSSFNNDKTKPMEERAWKAATAWGYDFETVLSNTEIKKLIDPAPEQNRFFRVLEYDGKSTPLRMFSDMFVYPHEPEMTAALKRLLVGPKVIGMVQGNDERSPVKTGDKAYQNILTDIVFRNALVNNGFEIVNISATDSIVAIPEDLAVLIIADPMSGYQPEFLKALDRYLSAGGNLLLAGEPGKQSITNPIAEKLGVHFAEGMLLQESKNYSLDLIQASFTKAGRSLFPFPADAVISMPGAVALSYDSAKGYRAFPVLTTNRETSWNKTGSFNLESDKITFNPDTDSRTEAPVALALTRQLKGKEQKILVTGDADFMSNGELGRRNLKTKNAEFTLKMFKWFSDNAYPIDATRPESIDTKIKVSKEGVDRMKLVLLGLFPAMLFGAGGLTIIKRRRK